MLISDSEWNGGADYFGDRAHYFKAGDEESLCRSLALFKDMVGPKPSPDHKDYIEQNFSDRRMVDDMLRRIQCNSIAC